MVSVGGVIGALVWSGFGGVVAWNGWTSYTDEQTRVGDAVEVRAEITDVGASETEERVDIEDGGTTTRTRYVPQIAFDYTFRGESYTADNLNPPSGGVETIPRYGSESRARDHLDEYAEGDAVTAYVDPDEPGEGFLTRETNTLRNLALVAAGGVFAAIGVVFLAAALVVF